MSQTATPDTEVAYVAACAVGMAYSDRCQDRRRICVEELAHVAGSVEVIDEARERITGLQIGDSDSRRRAEELLLESRAHLADTIVL